MKSKSNFSNYLQIIGVLLLCNCANVLRDYDLISQGLTSQFRLVHRGETDYFNSLLLLGPTDYSIEAYYVQRDSFQEILSDPNNFNISFKDQSFQINQFEEGILWEICGNQKFIDPSNYIFSLNKEPIDLVVEYNFNYPYRMLGKKKSRFFPKRIAEEYLKEGKAVGLITCKRYLIQIPSKSQIVGRNLLEIENRNGKHYIFEYEYNFGFVKNYKKFIENGS
ncbi:hypothetical protein EHO59_07585 [Leptospira semungkisensis]|uniref:Uncharacterized protein n=1 Tax=Leptospira semungkisensis TaxID=2484985 RepID=A0A4R9G8F0_9LEPT|nr:hypothetical protein [Leptospira semungkisensis]TGK07946.1 hypothetical protein EHO59_07585 [Leptospira semungkisensis]